MNQVLKQLILTYCLFFIATFVIAQKQANTWYFGYGSGLDFNHLPPQPITNNGTADSYEGCSTVSDNNGKLLFYTNGIRVVNKQHLVMLNGSGLNGERSSTNNTVIVPLPGNDSIYYLFTTGAALQETHQFQYNIINMKGDGGLGEVTIKNSFIEDTIFEKIAAARHCNNRDVWVVIHKWGTDEYHAYLVTSAGLNPVPVISHTGLVINGNENNEIGTLKFSGKGNKLAAIHAFQYDAVELMDFDNTTGVISNPVVFHPNTSHPQAYPGVYGAEFSPNGRLLYVSANNSLLEPAVLFQFDITSNNAATILATKQVIATTSPWFGGALQMGPDLKIYMAMWKDTAISVIEDPDVSGPGCNFNYNKIYMGPVGKEPVQFGLPTFIQSYFDTTSNPYDFSRLGNCADRSVTFKINRVSGIDSVKWDFGDGQKSQAIQPTNNYPSPGFYDVTLVVYKIDCSGLNDTIKRRIWIADSPVFLGKDTTSCDAILLDIGVDEADGFNYLWNTGFTGSRITTTANGLYWLDIEQNGCKLRDTINLTTKPPPIVNLGPDTSVCLGRKIVLIAGNTTANTYLWSTGETTPYITIEKAATYYVRVSESSCIGSDTLTVLPGDCEVFVPTAFTPNNDGLNDNFGASTQFAVQSFRMEIFNKWGQTVFEANDNNKKWDGTFKGKNMPNGAYIWIMNYVNTKGKKKYLQGTVLLIR